MPRGLCHGFAKLGSGGLASSKQGGDVHIWCGVGCTQLFDKIVKIALHALLREVFERNIGERRVQLDRVKAPSTNGPWSDIDYEETVQTVADQNL